MESLVKNPAKKRTTTNKIVKVVTTKKEATATAKAKVKTSPKVVTQKAKSKKPSAYQTEVLGSNKALKLEMKSFAGCLKTMVLFKKEMNLTGGQIKAIDAALSNKNHFAALKSQTRTSKAGNHSPFFILQAIYKVQKAVNKAKTVK